MSYLILKPNPKSLMKQVRHNTPFLMNMLYEMSGDICFDENDTIESFSSKYTDLLARHRLVTQDSIEGFQFLLGVAILFMAYKGSLVLSTVGTRRLPLIGKAIDVPFKLLMLGSTAHVGAGLLKDITSVHSIRLPKDIWRNVELVLKNTARAKIDEEPMTDGDPIELSPEIIVCLYLSQMQGITAPAVLQRALKEDVLVTGDKRQYRALIACLNSVRADICDVAGNPDITTLFAVLCVLFKVPYKSVVTLFASGVKAYSEGTK